MMSFGVTKVNNLKTENGNPVKLFTEQLEKFCIFILTPLIRILSDDYKIVIKTQKLKYHRQVELICH